MASEKLHWTPPEAEEPVLDEEGFRTVDYLTSEQGKKELAEEAKYESFFEDLEKRANNGEITDKEFMEEAERKFDEFDEIATKAREDYRGGLEPVIGSEFGETGADGSIENIEDLTEEELEEKKKDIEKELIDIDKRLGEIGGEKNSEEDEGDKEAEEGDIKIEEVEEVKENEEGDNTKIEETEEVVEDEEDEEDDIEIDDTEDGEEEDDDVEDDGTEPDEPEKAPEDPTEEELEGEKKDIDEEVAEIDKKLGETEESEEDKIEKEAKKDRERRIKELDKELAKIRPELAELYARNRRLFVGKKNAYKFAKAENRYEELLDEYTKLKAKDTFETGKQENLAYIANRVEEMRAEIDAKMAEFSDSAERTDDEIKEERDRLNKEADEKLKAEYDAKAKELEAKVNAEFLKDYLEQQSSLEDETIDKLDNGTICRKFVSKVLNNKHLKRALIVAGAAGLAIGGGVLAAGLAAGTMAVGFGYTAGGIAAGAAKGLFTGSLMSRQDSKNSAVRSFASEEEIKKKLKDINVLTLDSDTRGVARWLIDQYQEANDADSSSNKKRTLISAGIGAAIGAVASGIQINNVSSHTETDVGTDPTKIEPTKFGDVNIPKGHGAYDTFTQMGGDPSNMQKALDIMYQMDAKYGLVPGSNGEVAGINGMVGNFAHTYPGPISSWPDVAQGYIRDVAEEWARQGLIPSNITGGGPIYDTITRTVTDYIPNAFMNFLTRAVAYAGAGAIGGAIGGRESTREEAPDESSEPTPTESTPETADGSSPEAESSENDSVNRMKELILNNPSVCGGEEGVRILTGETEFNDGELQEYWDGLNNDSKIWVYYAIRGVNDYGPEGSDPKWGRSFRHWLTSKKYEELFPSETTTSTE